MSCGPSRASTSQCHIRNTLKLVHYLKGDVNTHRARFNETLQPALGGSHPMDGFIQHHCA